MNKIIFSFLGIFSCFFLMACTPTPTATVTESPTAVVEVTEAVQSDEVLIVTGEYPPHVGETIDGQGYTSEIVRSVFAEMGRPMRIEFYPWARGQAMVENGEAWMTYPYVGSAERREIFLFTDPLAYGQSRWFYYGETAPVPTYENLSQLRPFRIGAVVNFWYMPAVEEAGLTIDLGNDDVANLQKLQAGRIDLYLGDELVMWDIIRANFPDDVNSFHTLDPIYDANPLVGLVSHLYPDTEGVLAEFNSAFQRIKDDGTYEAILERFNVPLPPTTPNS